MVPDWLKHAFAVERHQPPSDADLRLVDRLAREVVRRRLTAPALAFLEMSRPANYIGAQTLHFFAPLVTTLFDSASYSAFAKFLERRDAIDILCRRIEEVENLEPRIEN